MAFRRRNRHHGAGSQQGGVGLQHGSHGELVDRGETDTPVNPNSIMSEERRAEAEARRTGIRGTRSASNGRNPVFSGMSTGRRPIGFPLKIICTTIRLRKNPRSI